LVRVGVASVAAGVAGLTVILSLGAWAVHGVEPEDATSVGTQSDVPPPTAAFHSFDERFSSGRSVPASGSVTVKTVVAALPIIATIDAPPGPDPEVPARGPGAAVRTPEPRAATRPVGTPPQDAVPSNSDDTTHTAIYDISAHNVYLPNGKRLEAHSGFGEHMDDVRFVHLRSRGPTPPNVYELKLRESLFHGVQAIRLTPLDGSKMYGREGILAHSFMLGPNGQSNGCVSFKDYPAFLEAYLRGEITRLVVVQRLDDPPRATTAADWFSDKLKSIFGRS
jgi:type VI secretion system (T6SS) effector TldE1-like protein